jgi:pyruvate kinase
VDKTVRDARVEDRLSVLLNDMPLVADIRPRGKKVDFLVTLWPSFSHFNRFASDSRLSGIRLNSAMVDTSELDHELALIAELPRGHVPLYFDIKGRQLRVREAINAGDHLELILNHPIQVNTPCTVLLKAGSDNALLVELKDGGTRLVFGPGDGSPHYKVKPGESVCVRDRSFRMLGDVFPDYEIEKIEKVHKAGFTKYFLSYVESDRDIDQLREMVGDAEIVAKIESRAGLEYVANRFKPADNLSLLAARGDLYVEVDKPHEILAATKMIAQKDPYAMAGSRIFLSLVRESIPECHDFTDIAWLYDIGYRRMMLCDEICLKGDLMARAVSAFTAFRDSYAR